jgi:tRNA modification GTPase
VTFNRAILMTPPGAGAIAVVRIVGDHVAPFLQQHFSRPSELGRCVHGQLRDVRRLIDDPVVVRFADDRAELNVHGGPWVVQATMDLLAREGFAIVTGDDALRDPAAFDSDDPIEAEMLAALPLARTEQVVAGLLQQPGLWREFLSQPSHTRDKIDPILNDHSLWWMLHPPRVAIIGEPNVGKSTLANQLFGQQRSITADVPGTTRDWVGELANIDGLAVMLVDTPGMRQTADAIEREAIGRASEQIGAADLVIIVFDATRTFETADELIARHPNAIAVANKCDLVERSSIDEIHLLPISATLGDGMDELRSRICRAFISDRHDRARWWTTRQRDLLLTQFSAARVPPHRPE